MRASERRILAHRRARKTKSLPKEWDTLSIKNIAAIRSVKHVYWLPVQKKRTGISSEEQPVFYRNQLLYFSINRYLINPEKLWLVESLIGSTALDEALSSGNVINDNFIENLFKTAPFSFYLSSDKSYLLGYNDELTQLDFGPLTEISALTALQQVGIATLEQAKEKTVVRL